MKNKGQVDMMGLVVIVVLLVLIGLFSLFFIAKTPGSEERDVYYSLKAYNFANALSKASIQNTNAEALILSCCEGDGGSCNLFLDFAEDNFYLLGEYPQGDLEVIKSAKFELICGDYSGVTMSRGECGEGVASESIILQSGDRIRLNLCRK